MITLKTLSEATAQDVFNQVARHLLRQDEKSIRPNGCAYRGEEGLKCAAGCLIGDDEYDPSLEGKLWVSLVNDRKVCSNHSYLIEKLQVVHDSQPPECWKDKLFYIATLFDLNTDVLKEKIK